jgi:DNA-binding response OmpR family regulator
MFLKHLYGGMDEPELNIFDVFIYKLCKNWLKPQVKDHIENVWVRGYVLRYPVLKNRTALAVAG